MAVHGAAARMMVPATYWSASPGPISPAKSCLKNTHARKAMLNGLTSQLTNRPTRAPFGPWRPPRPAHRGVGARRGGVGPREPWPDEDPRLLRGLLKAPPPPRRFGHEL